MNTKTGWPPGLLQDDSRDLSRWFASRPGAHRLAAEAAVDIERARAAELNRLTLSDLLMCTAIVLCIVVPLAWHWFARCWGGC